MISKRNVIIFTVTCAVILTAFFLLKPAAAPWEAQGHFVLAVRSVPGQKSESGTTFGFGIDNLVLYRPDGSTERVTVRNRRVLLTQGTNTLTLVLDTSIPVGAYTGFGFMLKSPETRNAWQQDTAPSPVTLAGESIELMAPYTVAEDVTTAVILSFETTQALHTKDATQFYLPVIQVETRSDSTVTLYEGNKVDITGGTIAHSATFGMDWDGRMRFNYRTRTEPVVDTPAVDTTQTEERIEEIASTTETMSTSTIDVSTTTNETEEEGADR